MNFAQSLTNTGESIVYVCILLIGIHLLFNFKIDRVLLKNKVVPLKKKPGSNNSGSGSGSANVASERHLSNALSNTVHIMKQQSKRIKGSSKYKPAPAGKSRISFNDLGRMSGPKEEPEGKGTPDVLIAQ